MIKTGVLSSHWLFVFVIIDMTFLPMFHINAFPYKICYIILLFVGLIALLKRYPRTWENTKFLEFLFLFSLLSIFSIMGSLWFNFYFGKLLFYGTLRQVIIYLFASIGILYGMMQRKNNLNYIIYLIPIYLVINIIVIFYYSEVGWLEEFYNLNDERTQNLINIRGAGLFYNPNISSLTMNMLFLMAVVGIRNNSFHYRSSIVIIGMVYMVFTMHIITGSRNQFVAAVFITLFLIYYLFQKKGKVKNILKYASVFLVITFLSLGLISSVENKPYVLKWGFRNIGKLFIVKNIKGTEDKKSLFYRPFEKLNAATERFLFSPVFGSGADGSRDTFAAAKMHNDWFDVLVTSGIIGLVVFLLIVVKTFNIGGYAMAVPFLLPGITNSFIRAPQSFILYFIFLGFLIGQRKYTRDLN